MPEIPAEAVQAAAAVDHEDFRPEDIPHDVVIKEALAPYLGGFEEAEEAPKRS
ncbi:hypothetical protein [Nonomuraea sp. NPDC049028]|uniref:hypothetical protein n=1 Tax=Nonomuraea sp. NPDC049028 TaxID=3364348 RepID=UPI0037139537